MSLPKILVVDDQPINVQLLKRKLEREGIHVAAAYTGQEALEVVKAEKPDLILLDVMMPDMDGIEVCHRLQESEDTRSIPVIFITARSSKEGKLEGLNVGAVDYITKPIDLDETLARVQTQLRFVVINREMLDLQRRLVEARRAATIGAITQGIAHNLNNLLGVVMGYLDLVKSHCDKPSEVKENARQAEIAGQRIITIIKQLSTVAGKGPVAFAKCNLQHLLEGSILRYQADNEITEAVTLNNPLGELEIETHVEAFEDAVAKILINAWESYDGLKVKTHPVTITTQLIERPKEGKFVEIRIDDHGCGVDPKIRDSMFEPFVSTKRTVGVGMGLTIARHTFQSMGGELVLANRHGGGTSAILLHPTEQPPEPLLENE
ncbi:MAG TPA: hybrid sensor histidine kinase/response regulator [Opitutaceae bacterium]|jgi:two-component system sensor histidine kinase/response regulator|nr:hybrid sensor histidine kinase/response regulator [Opitutaceae bacterium]